MNITSAKFLISVADSNNLPDYKLPEIAIAGKSNVGKSSFINYIVNMNKLAHTSGEPGRTRLLNYFEINKGQFIFVDLPGYGYAKVSKTEKEKWGELIETYLLHSPNLKHIFVLLDIRHDPTQDDLQLIDFLYHYSIPFSIVATKADKLSRMAGNNARQNIASKVGLGVENIYLISSSKKTGKEAILDRIDQILMYN